jgi:hypothetical protein
MKKQFCFLLTIILLLMGCSRPVPPPGFPPTISSTNTATVFVTKKSTATMIPIHVKPTDTLIPNVTTIIPSQSVETQCINVVPVQPSKMGIDPAFRISLIGFKNRILSSGEKEELAPPSYILNPNSGDKVIIKKAPEIPSWICSPLHRMGNGLYIKKKAIHMGKYFY